MEVRKQIQISALVDEEDVWVLRNLADEAQRTFAAELRLALKAWIEAKRG
jgi:hypothetical protein